MSNQRESKPQQRDLSAQELEMAASFTKKWSASQLQLIWRRKMPVGCTMEDFQLFVYSCETRGLDPLLGEAWARRQFDSESGEHRLIIMLGIHGLTKLADSTGELDGISESVEGVDGKIISATATVYRKGCSHPFTATAYFDEYAAYKFGGGLQKNWAEKGRVMIQKCALALALRLGFGAVISGFYAQEEFRDEGNAPSLPPTAPPPPDSTSEFHIEEVEPGTKTEEEKKEEVKPEQPSDKEAKPALTPMQQQDVIKQAQLAKNRALIQRLLVDLACPAHLKGSLLPTYIKGYLNADTIPKDAGMVYPALEALDLANTADPKTIRAEFADSPYSLGKRLKELKDAGN